jgi:hypothetical protein
MPKATFAKDRQSPSPCGPMMVGEVARTISKRGKKNWLSALPSKCVETETNAKEDKMIPEQSGIPHVV